VRDPLVDFRLFRSRSLLGADLGALFVGAGLFAVFFFLVLWMQQVHGYSPLRAGFAFLPMTGFIVVGAAISSQLLTRIGPRPLLIVGPGLGAAGMLALALRLSPDSSYVSVILPALCVLALGMGMTFVALTSSAVAGVPQEDAGVASALLNSGQQIGGSLGLAILTAVSTARTDAIAAGPPGSPAFVSALVDGWALGFIVAAGFLAMAGIVAGGLVRLPRTESAAAEPAPVPAGQPGRAAS
jgi:predicted MFS family arabinose efflux permease